MHPINKILVLDPGKCNGCRSCELTCSVAREGVASVSQSRIKIVPFEDADFYVPIVCQQCGTPYCAQVCPSGCLVKNDEMGVVEYRESRCTGCKMCLIACPFGAIRLSARGKILKCDLCQGEPACIGVCQPRALTYDYSDEIGRAKRIAAAQGIKQSYQREPIKC